MLETWALSLGQNDSLGRELQPTPVFLPGKSHGLRILVGYSPWGLKGSDTTEGLHFTHSVLVWEIPWAEEPGGL